MATDLTPDVSNPTLFQPARYFVPVTPSDSTDLTVLPRALIIANGGTLKVNDDYGTTVTLTVPAGVLPIRVARVWSNGTTATGITAIW